VGIGRPAPGQIDPVDYLLTDFKSAERRELPEMYGRAAEATESIVRDGIVVAMNRFNGKRTRDDA
jgi:PTH1 family peptidyl-tRNA hydrolase